MNDGELQDGMESEGMSRSWTSRYIELLAFIRAQRDVAIAAAEGHSDVIAPVAPDHAHESDLEMGHRLLAVLEKGR